HLRTLLEASGAAAELTAAAVPLLPRAREAAERGAIPGGTTRNVEGVADAVTFAGGVDATTRLLLADAQTSGGLLIAVAPERADAEALDGGLRMTGGLLAFPLHDLESFAVLP